MTLKLSEDRPASKKNIVYLFNILGKLKIAEAERLSLQFTRFIL
jgi:hypothetical protein